jgi:hypothetical protein
VWISIPILSKRIWVLAKAGGADLVETAAAAQSDIAVLGAELKIRLEIGVSSIGPGADSQGRFNSRTCGGHD